MSEQPPVGGTPPVQPEPPQQSPPPAPPMQTPYQQQMPPAPPQQPYPPQGYPQQGQPLQQGQAPQPYPPTYAVPPGGPGRPPPGPPIATPGGNFKSGKNKTIAMIVGAVVGIGVLGALGAAVLGGSDDGASTAKSGVEPGGQGSGILHPTPVGNISPAPQPGTVTPSASTAPAPEPTPTPAPEPTAPAPAPVGDAVTIGGGVQVAVPSGWHVLGEQGDSSVNLADDAGSWIYALTGTVEATADAASVLQGNLDTFLPGDYYSQLQLGDINALDPFGSIVSAAVLQYDGQWVDTQGSTPVRGIIYAAVRQDGTALLMSAEHSPPKDFQDSSSSWGPVIDKTFNAFGGS